MVVFFAYNRQMHEESRDSGHQRGGKYLFSVLSAEKLLFCFEHQVQWQSEQEVIFCSDFFSSLSE